MSLPFTANAGLKNIRRETCTLDAQFNNLLENFAEHMPPQLWRDVHVAIALSGGADSVALLRATLAIKQVCGGQGGIFALHVNHHLRGEESDGDALWCAELCGMLGIPAQVLDGNVASRAQAEGDGIEAAARGERYALLTEAAEARGVRYLFLAHNRNDQVETVLFRLLRGTGLRGLAGMAESRPLTPALTLARPLLGCTRGEILEYLATLGQDFRTDSSNAAREFTRNRIRSELLPLLRSDYNLQVDDAIVRLAVQAGETQQFVEHKARELLDSHRERMEVGEITLRVAGLNNQPSILVSEALRIAWREAQFAEQAMTQEWWVALAALAMGDASNVVLNLPGDVRAEVVEGEVLVVGRCVGS